MVTTKKKVQSSSLTSVIEEALIVDVDFSQGPLSESVGFGQDSLLEIVDKVPRPYALKLLLELVYHVSSRLRHQKIFYTGLQAKQNFQYIQLSLNKILP